MQRKVQGPSMKEQELSMGKQILFPFQVHIHPTQKFLQILDVTLSIYDSIYKFRFYTWICNSDINIHKT